MQELAAELLGPHRFARGVGGHPRRRDQKRTRRGAPLNVVAFALKSILRNEESWYGTSSAGYENHADVVDDGMSRRALDEIAGSCIP